MASERLGFPFLVIVDSFYCLTFLEVSSAPQAVQKASISWAQFCQLIGDEFCDQWQEVELAGLV